MRYFVKKVLGLIITLVVTSFVVFLAFEFISGDPAVSKLGINATPEAVEELRTEMGLNRPFLVRYFSWLLGLFVGNFGESYSYGVPVEELILDKIPINLFLSLMALIFIILLSLPIGLYTAKHEGSFLDRMIMLINQIVMAVPPFLLGIGFTYVFGLLLHLFAPGNYISYKNSFGGFLGYMICPALALAIPKSTMMIKLLRNTILSEAKMDYVRTAYSRGNDTTGILYKHILINASMSSITFLGMLLADMIASGIVIEQVFGIPGLGRILLNAISTRDYPVVQAIVMIIAFGVIVIGYAVDVIYSRVDPRVNLE